MTWSHRPALDGLRSVAVYLVLLFHTGLASMGGGFIGVDLFFVLSGFLVSTVILTEIRARHRADRPLLRPPGATAAAGSARGHRGHQSHLPARDLC
ncbi:MAG: hypothetical protein M3386_08900, partial [Actinomycetota bacterium]|nr:hypothetical protein [Actinomycetota bacterium]